jgi:hypothetical protein
VRVGYRELIVMPVTEIASLDPPVIDVRFEIERGEKGPVARSRCAAVVFDVARRTLWLEPPCDRPSPEPNAGWVVALSPEPAHADRPWLLSTVFADGAAALAGLRGLGKGRRGGGPTPARRGLRHGESSDGLSATWSRGRRTVRATGTQ